ncbi:MAG: apolipoprotein N-acyltransferase [Acidimicrobiales bacterium]
MASGVALGLSLPPFGLWPLAFVGSGLLYWRLGALGPKWRLMVGEAAGIGCFGIGLFWAERFNWYGWVVLVVVESATMAVASIGTFGRVRLVTYGCSFTLMEALRQGWPFGGLPVGGVFLGQANGPLLGAARLGGPLLITALVFAGGGALFEVASRVVPSHPHRAALHTTQGICVLSVVVGLVVAAQTLPDGGPPIGSVEVAAIQGGRPARSDSPAGGVLSSELDATASLLESARRPSLVLWPEDSVPIARTPSEPLVSTVELRALTQVASFLRATLVAGLTINEPGAKFRNEIVALGPDGKIVSTFEKVHRVPFGEYVPLRGIVSHLADVSQVPRDAIAGHGSGLMDTPAGPLGAVVSFEVFFADRGRSATRAGAELLVVPTNTNSFPGDQMPSQELAAARVLATAEGRDLLQSSVSGYSVLVSNRGRVLASTPLSRRRVLVGTLSLRSGATVYQTLGDIYLLVVVAALLAACWLIWVASTERRRQSADKGAGGEQRAEPVLPAVGVGRGSVSAGRHHAGGDNAIIAAATDLWTSLASLPLPGRQE